MLVCLFIISSLCVYVYVCVCVCMCVVTLLYTVRCTNIWLFDLVSIRGPLPSCCKQSSPAILPLSYGLFFFFACSSLHSLVGLRTPARRGRETIALLTKISPLR